MPTRGPAVVSINLADLEASLERDIEISRFSTIPMDEDELGLSLSHSAANKDIHRTLKQQNTVILKHEAFIKQLKGTLESLLGERIDSKKNTPEWRQELQELRVLLRFDESVMSSNSHTSK